MSDISKERLATISDSDLQGEIDLNEIKRKSLEQSLKWLDEETAAYRAELKRRTMEKYWAAHPEFIKLESGDELVITPSFVKQRETHGGIEVWYRKDKITIGSVWGFDGEIVVAVKGWKDGICSLEVGGEKMDIVQDMRRAWLAREAEGKS